MGDSGSRREPGLAVGVGEVACTGGVAGPPAPPGAVEAGAHGPGLTLQVRAAGTQGQVMQESRSEPCCCPDGVLSSWRDPSPVAAGDRLEGAEAGAQQVARVAAPIRSSSSPPRAASTSCPLLCSMVRSSTLALPWSTEPGRWAGHIQHKQVCLRDSSLAGAQQGLQDPIALSLLGGDQGPQ